MFKFFVVIKYGKVLIVKFDFNFVKVKGFVGFKILVEVFVGVKMSLWRFKKILIIDLWILGRVENLFWILLILVLIILILGRLFNKICWSVFLMVKFCFGFIGLKFNWL